MTYTRRDFVIAAGATASSLIVPQVADAFDLPKKRHIVTLSFDDGFRKSSVKTAEIYEKYKLSACINVVASAHMKDFRPPDYPDVPRADFGLWNDLKSRGHEIMPHGYRHANKRSLPLAESKDLILRCLDVFNKELKGFDRKQAVFNFPYNASTPELEQWLPTQVRAFRTGGAAINPLPHKEQVKLTCTSFGPGNCEKAIDREIEKLLGKESGWLIFNTHGLDEEGWGPIRAAYLEQLLERLLAIETVEILPAGKALTHFASARQ
ncbi:MAG: polysaccharide deacetylase family protein [Pirellulaceae bacterium]